MRSRPKPAANQPASAMPMDHPKEVLAMVANAPRPDPLPAPLVAIRHPGSRPLAFGPFATGGVVYKVDHATAERLMARGFERVPETYVSATPTATDAAHPALPAGTVTAPAYPAPPAPED